MCWMLCCVALLWPGLIVMRGLCMHVPAEDVAPAICHDAVWRALEMCADTQLIAHCPAHHQQCRRETGELGDEALEAVGRLVFAEDIISKPRALKRYQGFEHGRCGSGGHIA